MKKFFLITSLFLGITINAQFVKFNPGGDSSKSVTVEGYADVYFGYDFNKPKDFNRPYFVSHHRHYETNINLAYVSLKYNSSRARATFTPGFGTYMNANYSAERLTLRNIVEANVGVKLFKNKNIWLDAGVLGAPYTTETAIAFDQLLYSRSFAAEYSPYYLTGGKLSLPLSKKINLYLYAINGWQVIEDINSPLSFASQLEIKPSEKVLINWSTYLGNEQSASASTYRRRRFSDLFFIYNPNNKWNLSFDTYIGNQNKEDSLKNKSSSMWGQFNINARYFINDNNSISGRVEFFNDHESVFVVPVTGVNGFDCASYSLCISHFFTSNIMFRLEGRYFKSSRNIFYDTDQIPTKIDVLLISGLIAKF